MKDIIKKTFKLLVKNDAPIDLRKKIKKRPFKELTERELIQLESQIGAKLFGPVKTGNRREFFNEDPTSWVWYEEWIGSDKKPNSITTRYEVHDKGILKIRTGEPCAYIDGQELDNLVMATQMYHERIMRDIYKCDPQTGKSII